MRSSAAGVPARGFTDSQAVGTGLISGNMWTSVWTGDLDQHFGQHRASLAAGLFAVTSQQKLVAGEACAERPFGCARIVNRSAGRVEQRIERAIFLQSRR